MNEKINPDNESFDSTEEYFRRKYNLNENETDEYFPQETAKPPHYQTNQLRINNTKNTINF